MNQLATIVKRYSYVATAAVLSLGMLMPLILSGNAGAAQLEARSVTLSSSAPGNTPAGAGVTYEFTFTAVQDTDIQGLVIDFCEDDGATSGGPISGTLCVLPSGMTRGSAISSLTINGAATDAANWNIAPLGASGLVLDRDTAAATVNADDVFVVTITGFTNPTLVQPDNVAYARIYTYGTAAGAAGYTTANPAIVAEPVDTGSVAFAIVPQVNVSAIVRETLTFCVGGGQTLTPTASSIGAGCGPNAAGNGTGAITAPSISLGAPVGGINVLDNQDVYTGNIFYQLTTNAATGADIRIKGASTSLQSGGNSIPSIGGITEMPAGTAAFGMNVFAPGTATSGTNLSVDPAYPNDTSDPYQFALESDTTSTYGDRFAFVATPTRDANGRLMFGATASADTQAGIYSAQFSLIATPKY